MGRSLDPGVGRSLAEGSDLAGHSLVRRSHTAEARSQVEARNREVAGILELHSQAEGHRSHNLVAGSRRKQAVRVAAHSPAGDRIQEGARGTPAHVTR